MSDTTFGVLFALCSVMVTAVLLLISRFNQRLTDPSTNNQHWIWSGQLDRTGRWLLIVGVFLLLIGFLIGDTRFIPIEVPAHISGGSMLGGFFCLVLATPLIGGAILWRLQLCYGLRQLVASVKHRLPEPPSKQTLFSIVQFAGQLCVAMIAVGFGFLRVIAASGVLDCEKKQDIANDITSEYDYYYNSNKYKYIHLYDEQDI